MAKRFLTLNVGASCATLAEYVLSGKELVLSAYGSAPMPPVELDVPGAMESALTPAIHEIMREAGIRPAPVAVSLSSQMVFARSAKLAVLGDGDLMQSARYEVEQNVPFPIDEIVWGSQALKTADDGDVVAMIVAAKVELVRSVTNAVTDAGLRPEIVDAAPVSVCNALYANYPDLDGCSIVLDIGARSTSMIIVDDGNVYVRSITIGGNTIDKELAQTFGCSLEEAEDLKKEIGYVSPGGVAEDADETADRVLKVIRAVMTRLHAEISRSVNFYRLKQGGGVPQRVFLAGGTSRLPRIDEFFGEMLAAPIEILDPFKAVSVSDALDISAIESDACTLVESAGLALRMAHLSLLDIDLMPPEFIERRAVMRRIPYLVGGAVGILGALAVSAYSFTREAAESEGRAMAAQQAIGRISQKSSELSEVKETMKKRLAAAEDFSNLLKSRSAALSRLRYLSGSMPPGFWIKRWRSVKPKEATPGVGVVVEVRAWHAIVEQFKKDHSGEGGAGNVENYIAQSLKKLGEGVVYPESVEVQEDFSQNESGNVSEFHEYRISAVFRRPSDPPFEKAAQNISQEGL